MATNKAMKFHLAVFRGHEMPFMGYSQKIHGIFIKLWFIVKVSAKLIGDFNRIRKFTIVSFKNRTSFPI